MFPIYRRRVSLGFSTMVFLLLVLQGVLFIAVGYERDIRRIDSNIVTNVQYLTSDIISTEEKLSSITLTPLGQERARVFDLDGSMLFAGTIFIGHAPVLEKEPWILEHNGVSYRILTIPIYTGSTLRGYYQMGERVSTLANRLLDALPVIIIESTLLAFLVFLVGILFQKYSMRPAYEIFNRLEQFAQDAGHELKTPLASARSSLEAARSDGEHERHEKEAIEDIESMAALTDALLQLTTLTKSSIRKEPVEMSRVVESVLQELSRQCEAKNIRCKDVLDQTVIRTADASLFRVIVRNLMHNAVKYTNRGGEVTVTLTPDYLSVRDTGVGMTPDVLEKIYNRFFKADPSRSDAGFGLGLTLVKRIVDIHGWQLDVRSSPGVGTTFTLWFDRRRRRNLWRKVLQMRGSRSDDS